MAVKIVRQPKNIALLGVPSSAASLAAGPERAPAALRAAGIAERLGAAGFTVTDHGDCKTRTFVADDEHPRVRNAAQVLAGLEELRPKIEVAVKSGALLLILGGDNSPLLATLAGMRRYYKDISLVYLDRDAGLNVPDTTPSGCVDGMVISHVIGRGAPELVRYWREPPLVREPNVALFGVDRLDRPERDFLEHSPLRRYLAADIARMGIAAAAEQAFDRVHGQRNEFVLHLDLDVIASEDFAATSFSAPGGLSLEQVRQALSIWARQPKLAAIQIGCYNPALDADGSAAKKLIDLLAEVLAPRLEATPAETSTPGAAGKPPEDAQEPIAAAPSQASSHEEPAPAPPAEPAAEPEPEPATEPTNEAPESNSE